MTSFPKTCAVLEAAGIDPKTIPIDGVFPSGYTAWVFDESGKVRVVNDGEIVTDWHPWPTIEVARAVYDARLEDFGITEPRP